ncbi:MAG: hypothetical protein KAS39_01760, partial [Actinomycetia bacterium]|nr:hypothetical protein [Actinomycetes bacterium]
MAKAIAETINAFASFFTGLGITFTHMFRSRQTLQYPYEKKVLPENSRGIPRLRGIVGGLELEPGKEIPPCRGTCPGNVEARKQNVLVAEKKYF